MRSRAQRAATTLCVSWAGCTETASPERLDLTLKGTLMVTIKSTSSESDMCTWVLEGCLMVGREEEREEAGVRREGGGVQQSWGSDWQVGSYTDIGSKAWFITEH